MLWHHFIDIIVYRITLLSFTFFWNLTVVRNRTYKHLSSARHQCKNYNFCCLDELLFSHSSYNNLVSTFLVWNFMRNIFYLIKFFEIMPRKRLISKKPKKKPRKNEILPPLNLQLAGWGLFECSSIQYYEHRSPKSILAYFFPSLRETSLNWKNNLQIDVSQKNFPSEDR